MRRLSSPNKTGRIKQTNLYKSSIRRRSIIGTAMSVAGLAAIAVMALPAISQVSAVGDNVNDQNSSKYTKVLAIGDSITAGYRPNDNYGSNYDRHAPCLSMQANLSNITVKCNGQVGSTTADWAGEKNSGYLGILENANVIKDYKGQAVVLTLGINDIWQNISSDKSASALDDIVSRLKTAGVAKIIINYPSAFRDGMGNNYTDEQREIAANLKSHIDGMVDGDTVMLGDTSSQSAMQGQSKYYSFDGTHMSVDGYDKLGEFWAEAYKRVIIDPDTINHNVTVDNKASTVTYTIDKDKSWFAPATGKYSNILVDGQIIDATNYTVTGDNSSTAISLNTDYVSKLANGKHSITIRYNDGVNFTDEFTISHDTSNNNNNTNVDTNKGNTSNSTITNPNSEVIKHVVPAVPNTGYRK